MLIGIGGHLDVAVLPDGKGGRRLRAQGKPYGNQADLKHPEELEALGYEFLKEAERWRNEREEVRGP